jgi:Bacterial Ig-like domain
VSNEGQFFISSNEPVQFYYDIREATYTGQPTYSTLGNPNSTEVDIGLTLSNADGKEMVLYIKAVDAAGNTTEIQRRWTVDITGPTVQFTGGPSEGEVLTNNDVTFSWTASDPAPGSGVDQVLGCMNFIPEPGGHENYGTCRTSSPTTYTDMPDGNYQFILAATDRAGNQGEAIVRNFTVDTTP